MINSSLKNTLVKSFGSGVLSRDSINFAVWCPSCNDNRKSKKKLVVRLDTGVFHCWVCGLKGKNIEFLFKKFAPQNLDKISNFKSAEKKVEDRSVSIPKGLKLISGNSRDPDLIAVKKYLYSRGLNDRDISRWRIMSSATGQHRRRVFIPSFDADGAINYYVSRAIDDSSIRYRNSNAKKMEIIFNEIDIDWHKKIILVEGVFDAMKSPDNCIPILGSSLSKKSLLYQELTKNKCTVIIALDSDQKQKAFKVAQNLQYDGCDVSICFPPKEKDFGDLNKKNVFSILRNCKPYNRMLKISHKISGIKSGSII